MSAPRIQITTAIGKASTRISAFDDALMRAGVHDMNLIPLSSVIPEGAYVDVVKSIELPEHTRKGDKLYCVYSRLDLDPGVQIPSAVGLGWVSYNCWEEDASGEWAEYKTWGLFVEDHVVAKEGDPLDRAKDLCEVKLRLSLKEMQARRELFATSQTIVQAGINWSSHNEHMCLLAIAAYETNHWQTI